MSDKINGYNKIELTKAWLSMSSDDFYVKYGFNWVPLVSLRNKISEEAYVSGDYNNPFRNDFRG